jgi:multiple sugar transport system permease protein
MRRAVWTQMLVYGLLIAGAVFVAYPFFYMVMNSLKPGPEILNAPNSLPSRITFSGYVDVFARLDMLRLFRNSLIVSVSVTLLNTVLSALAAYAVAKIPCNRSRGVETQQVASPFLVDSSA